MALLSAAAADHHMTPFILVVDDFEDNRDLYVTALRDCGYRAEGAANGKEALDRIEETQPALVVMDLSMPVVDGWEATNRIKSDPKTAHITVVAVTSHATPSGLRDAVDAGADAVVTRPCLPEDLLMRVRALLPPRRAPVTSGRRVVLLVDDDDDSRRLFTFVLLRHGFEVVTATSSVEVVAALALQRADVLIVNEHSDEGAAAVTLENICAEDRPVVRVVVTRFDGPEALRRNQSAGFHVLAGLPCTPYDIEPLLRARLLSADEGHQAENELAVFRGGFADCG
jgi:CheY-like chemotaxis protein